MVKGFMLLMLIFATFLPVFLSDFHSALACRHCNNSRFQRSLLKRINGQGYFIGERLLILKVDISHKNVKN